MAPKKAVKKAGTDARKAFEHLGRVQSIASFAPAEHVPLTTLVSAADAAFRAHQYKESAHLLRAAEHLLFAAMVETAPAQISPHLLEAVAEEFDHLAERAAEHSHSEKAPHAIRRIYARMKKDAGSAMQQRNYRRALELVRGAEALTHLGPLHHSLPEPQPARKKLKA
jgi:hypothetical protein